MPELPESESEAMTTPTRFADAVAIVTGSTRGIGEGIARRFAREGAAVVVTGRSADAGRAVARSIRDAGGEAAFVETDVSDPEQVAALFEATEERFGGLDVLVNNAAVFPNASAEETTLEDWEFAVDVNFRGYWLCAKRAFEAMDRGAIVNVSSNHAFLTMPEHFPYNAIKAGINGMTRAMALDFGPRVRVNTINPGWIAVDHTERALSGGARERVESIHPAGRIGDPADVAGVAAFLASDDAAFVTGAEILVDGGRTAVMQDDTLPDYRARRTDGDPTAANRDADSDG
jgi:NAD(P)-dependent dehydrogenase (short-subunit alcohol dehydrogenase family)